VTAPGALSERMREARLRVEQIRLLLGVMKSSIAPGLLLVALLTWTLRDTADLDALLLWSGATTAGRLAGVWHAHYRLAKGIRERDVTRVTAELVALNAYDGVAWAALTWIALGSATLAGSILIMAAMAAIGCNAMFLLAPVRPAYRALAVSMLGLIAVRLVVLGDPAYEALAAASVLYVVALFRQARHAHDAACAAIELRFQNLELVESLRQESSNAEMARLEADEANLAKSKFLAAASHDLRQPVHAQGLFLELLARGELPPQQRRALENAKAATQASAEMLNTLLDFSRIEAGVIRPRHSAFHLQKLFHKLENELAHLADAKGIVYRCRETHLAVFSDPALLELMLRNLISNAIRYTERGGLLVACRRRGDQALIEIVDTGIGIADADRRAVFKEFHQLGNPERDRRKGLGLGLAITDGLARSLGHSLTLVSKPGRGSIFRVSLPRAQGAVIEDRFESVHLPAGGDDRLTGCRILVVDDDEAVRLGMDSLLTQWGCVCQAVESIDEALVAARQLRPELVISDFRLRELRTGEEAIAALRAELGEGLPALLITGDTAQPQLRDSTSSGVPVLHKPVTPAQLHRVVVDLLVARDAVLLAETGLLR